MKTKRQRVTRKRIGGKMPYNTDTHTMVIQKDKDDKIVQTYEFHNLLTKDNEDMFKKEYGINPALSFHNKYYEKSVSLSDLQQKSVDDFENYFLIPDPTQTTPMTYETHNMTVNKNKDFSDYLDNLNKLRKAIHGGGMSGGTLNTRNGAVNTRRSTYKISYRKLTTGNNNTGSNKNGNAVHSSSTGSSTGSATGSATGANATVINPTGSNTTGSNTTVINPPPPPPPPQPIKNIDANNIFNINERISEEIDKIENDTNFDQTLKNFVINSKIMQPSNQSDQIIMSVIGVEKNILDAEYNIDTTLVPPIFEYINAANRINNVVSIAQGQGQGQGNANSTQGNANSTQGNANSTQGNANATQGNANATQGNTTISLALANFKGLNDAINKYRVDMAKQIIILFAGKINYPDDEVKKYYKEFTGSNNNIDNDNYIMANFVDNSNYADLTKYGQENKNNGTDKTNSFTVNIFTEFANKLNQTNKNAKP